MTTVDVMNTTAYIRRASAAAGLLCLAVMATFVLAEPAHAVEVDLGQEITLPVGWGPAVVGLLIAVLTNLGTRVDARKWVKVAIALTLSAVAALAEHLGAVGWTFVPADLGKLFLTAWVWQLALHLGLVKPVMQRFLAPDKGLS